MKKLTILLVAIVSGFAAIAQKQPFEQYGYKVKIATLSKGKYIEHFDQDTIVQIGTVLLNRRSGKIVSFVKYDTTLGEYSLKPELISRWMSPDPLAHEFYSESPYNFSHNNPIRYMDPDGAAPVDCCPGLYADLITRGSIYFNNLSGAVQRRVSGHESVPANSGLPNDVRQMNNLVSAGKDYQTIAQAVIDGPGRVASFTDANDITVLANGSNLDGTKATTSDYVFAGVGLALPVSGSAIKKLAGGGLDILDGIVKKVGNISTHLTDKDVTGAVRDILGNPVVIGGKQYDHLGEVNGALRGLGNQLNKLNKSISSGDLTGGVLKEAQRVRSSLQNEKDRIQNLLNRAQNQTNE
jgi:Bacterial toxin 28